MSVIDYQYFSDDEFERIGSDSNRMNIAMMKKLVSLRSKLGIPLPLTSAWRSESRNLQVGGAKNSAHLYGRAVDLRIHGDTAFQVVSMAARFGFTGIGVHQKGITRGRFIHLDDMEFSEDLLRPTIWSYS
jgi:zinc D-Ala-D-Ala carboxypeptidase